MEQKIRPYVTLAKEASAEFIEKKSVFVGYAAHVETEEQALNFIKKISTMNGNATHNVYAYLFDWGRVARYSDAGEPHGTAGLPVLEIIRKNNFTDAVIVVTRYFGGILLGAGGLVRAYSTAARMAVDAAEIVTFVSYTEFTLICSYSEYQKIQNELPKYGVMQDDIEFADNVVLKLAVKDEVYADFSRKVMEMSAGKIKLLQTGNRYDI
jgi:Uncharacterized conserved protein